MTAVALAAGLVVMSSTYGNGTGGVGITVPERLALDVDVIIGRLVRERELGPVDRRDAVGVASWLLRCRSEDAAALRDTVVRALERIR